MGEDTNMKNSINILESYPDVLDVRDIKQIMNIGQRQAYELCNSGQFHVARAGTRIKVAKSVFLNWLEGN